MTPQRQYLAFPFFLSPAALPANFQDGLKNLAFPKKKERVGEPLFKFPGQFKDLLGSWSLIKRTFPNAYIIAYILYLSRPVKQKPRF